MADVLVRDSSEECWRIASPCWQGIHSDRAEDIVELYNSRDYSKEYKARFEEWEKQGKGGS